MGVAEIARGLGDLQVAPVLGDVPGVWVDVPGARSLSFNTESDSDELEGDNQVIAKVRNAPSLSGSIELGRINLAALAVLLGGRLRPRGVAGERRSRASRRAAATRSRTTRSRARPRASTWRAPPIAS